MSLDASQKILNILESLQDQDLLGLLSPYPALYTELTVRQKGFFPGTLTPYSYLQ